MQEITVIVALFLGLMMAKKKETRKFGQMTLNMGGKALEYLKGEPKGITRKVNRVEWMNKHHAEDKRGWEMPSWVIPKTSEQLARYPNADRVQDVAILFMAADGELPMLVHQKSALEGLDEVLCDAQNDGALVEDDGKILTLDMGDDFIELQFVRNNKVKFARFIVREIKQ